MDTFGKECMEEKKHLYKYKGVVGVPPLAMVDDMACPAACGIDSVEVAAYLNAKTNVKKLQFGVDKCHQLHIGCKKDLCPDLHIDNWGVTKCDEAKTGFGNLEDTFLGQHKVDEVDKEKYLGDILSADGSNMKNILSRKDKSVGVIKQICSILDETCFGNFHFEVAMILRGSLLLNSILTNSEVWYHLKEEELRILEKCDENLLRKIFEAPCTTPIPMLYLESGCKPVRYTILARRMMFLHYILHEDEESLIMRFFKAQKESPCKDDWYLTVIGDLEYLEIYLTFEHIKSASRQSFKNIVDEAISVKAHEYLVNKQTKMNKILHISYSELKIQNYMKSQAVNIQFCKFIFLLRSRMLDVSANFPGTAQELSCPVCKDPSSRDDQEHLLVCPELDDQDLVDQVPTYDDLFTGTLEKQVQVAAIIENKFRDRKKKLRLEKNAPGVGDQVNQMCSAVWGC